MESGPRKKQRRSGDCDSRRPPNSLEEEKARRHLRPVRASIPSRLAANRIACSKAIVRATPSASRADVL